MKGDSTMLEQISVFVENKTGRLASVMSIFNDNKIDIRAITIADTTDFGIIRIIVKQTEKALAALKEGGCTANVTKIIGFTIPDHSGALSEVISAFEEKGVGVEYCYSLMSGKDGKADIAVRVDNNEAASEILKNKGIQLLNSEDIG